MDNELIKIISNWAKKLYKNKFKIIIADRYLSIRDNKINIIIENNVDQTISVAVFKYLDSGAITYNIISDNLLPSDPKFFANLDKIIKEELC